MAEPTDDVIAQARLLQERFGALGDTVPALAWMTDLRQRCVWVNARWLAFTGRTMVEELGDGWLTVVHPDDRDALRAALDDEPRRVAGFALDLRLRGRDGDYRCMRLVGRARVGDDGAPVGCAGGCEDVHDLAAARDAVRRLADEVERYAYLAAHDLQEPLRGISISLGLVRRTAGDRLGAEAMAYLDKAEAEAIAMRERMRAMLAFNHVDREPPRRDIIDSERAVRRALDEHAELIARSQARIDVAPLPLVRGHEDQLVQVFHHLIANAIRFAGDRRPEIRVSGTGGTDEVVLTVSDNGTGIPAGLRERVFEPFMRIAQRSAQTGTGMGLAIVRKIVERHGGRVWIDDAPGGGSRFHFSWPGRGSR